MAIRTLERVDRRAARSNHMGLLSNDGRSRVSALSYTAASCRCPTRDGRPDRRGIATSRARTQVGFYSSGTAGTRREVALRPDGRWRGERQHAALIDGFQTRSESTGNRRPGCAQNCTGSMTTDWRVWRWRRAGGRYGPRHCQVGTRAPSCGTICRVCSDSRPQSLGGRSDGFSST